MVRIGYKGNQETQTNTCRKGVVMTKYQLQYTVFGKQLHRALLHCSDEELFTFTNHWFLHCEAIEEEHKNQKSNISGL